MKNLELGSSVETTSSTEEVKKINIEELLSREGFDKQLKFSYETNNCPGINFYDTVLVKGSDSSLDHYINNRDVSREVKIVDQKEINQELSVAIIRFTFKDKDSIELRCEMWNCLIVFNKTTKKDLCSVPYLKYFSSMESDVRGGAFKKTCSALAFNSIGSMEIDYPKIKVGLKTEANEEVVYELECKEDIDNN